MHTQHAGPSTTPMPGLIPGYTHELITTGASDPTTLQPGSFVYLWAPGVPIGDQDRILARVERTTRDTISARDLGSGVRCTYEVGSAYPVGLRWSWLLAAPPEQPVLTHGGLQVIDKAALDLEARRELLFGAPGSTVRIVNKNGESVTGVPVCVIIDGGPERICWVIVEGPTDARGPISYRVRYDDISTVIHGGGR